MTATVYKITCLATGKVYVGWTTQSLEIRWVRHQRLDKKCYLQHCIRKYGAANFTIEPLHEYSCNQMAMDKEVELIREWQLNIGRHPDGNGMNMTDGGEGTIGYTFTEEHRRKMSESRKGRKHSPQAIDNMRRSKIGSKNPMYGKEASEAQREAARKQFKENNPNKPGVLSHRYGKPGHMRGKKHSPETIEKIRASLTGRPGKPKSEETRKKLSVSVKKVWEENGHPGLGQKRSDESRERMRQSRMAYLEQEKASGIRYKHSEEAKEKMRAAAVNRKMTDEARAKMRESRLRYIERQKSLGLPYNDTKRKKPESDAT